MTNLHHALRSACVLLSACVVVLFTGCDADTQRAIRAATSEANGTVSNLTATDDSRIVDGEFDYGWTVAFTVTNTGKAGIISISPWISCSEGEWSRHQSLNFHPGESMNLSYFFHEPSINASNGQYGVKVTP